ncbi:MAG: hypothetical protein DYG89_42185 [Caldilinea sp. CFX5]|nr:hypothetical protein [Caldilinea sp. CFX5]
MTTSDVETSRQTSAATPPPVSPRRWSGAAWAILLIGVTILAGSIAQSLYRLTLPTDGWRWISGAVGTALEDTITYETNRIGQPSPIQPGDFVLAVAGHPYAELMAGALQGESPFLGQWQAGTTVQYLVQRGDAAVTLAVPLYHWQVGQIVGMVLGDVSTYVTLLSAAVGLFVFLKRPLDAAARVLFLLNTFFLAIYVSEIVYWGLPEIVHPPLLLVAQFFSNWIFGVLIAPTALLLALTFPLPKLFLVRWPLLVIAAVYGILPLLLLSAGPQPVLGWGWSAACGFLSLLSVGHTLWAVHDPVSRAQLRWAGLGFATLAFSILLEATNGFGLYPPALQQLIPLLSPLLQLAFPVALAVAILRYRLFDIDLIISRALVYGALTLCVVALYIGLVVYLGRLLRSEDNLLASLIATGVVAVIFQPLRLWLQRAVDRLLFGQRNEPYQVIATLSRQLESALAPNAVFTAIVATIGQSLKLPYVAILTADETQLQALYPHPTVAPPRGQLLRLPLHYQQQAVGVLLVAPRPGEAHFTAADQRLLSDLARQTGIALYAAQLTADVQRARQRLVFAREEERRRLRRDLHDGLGPQLAGQSLTLDVIARLLRQDPDQAVTLLHAVREQVQQAVSDIRNLIYGLRPPVLDDLGLNGALQEFTDRVRQQQGALQFVLHLPPLPTPLPAALDVAVYRIVQEAVNNVVRHAQATLCEVRLDQHDAREHGQENGKQPPHLLLTVLDNGIGLASGRLSGVGLQSMRERCEELGGQLFIENGVNGGTCIRAVLPLVDTELDSTGRDATGTDTTRADL